MEQTVVQVKRNIYAVTDKICIRPGWFMIKKAITMRREDFRQNRVRFYEGILFPSVNVKIN